MTALDRHPADAVVDEGRRRRTFAIISHPDGARPPSTGLRAAPDSATAEPLRTTPGVRVLASADGTLLALFETSWWFERVEADHPDWSLDPIVTDGAA